MKIAIDLSPLKKGNFLQHRIRGTGFYLENLKSSLEKYFPENDYVYFSRGETIPKADVVHFPFLEPFFLTLPLRMPRNSIVTVHDLIPFVFPEHFPSGLKGKIKWNLQLISLRKAKAIITDSEASKKDIAKFTGISEGKIHVVYLAAASHFKVLEKGDWEKEIKSKYSLPERFALYVGDVTWNKNVPNIVRACKEAGVKLVIVGKAFTEKEFNRKNEWNRDRAEVEDLVDSHVVGLGFVPNEDLVKIYNLANLLIMPSRYEGFGLPLLEAMQSGCPVVTSDRGSIREVVGESALFVDPDNITSIAKGVKKVIKDTDLSATMTSKGLEKANDFKWMKTARLTLEVYESIE